MPAISTTMLAVVWSASPLAAEPVDYSRDVKAVLKARCYACHGALKQESGLRLDTVAQMLQGGDGGPVVTAKMPAASRLVERIEAADLGTRMPPEGMPLTPEEIARIKQWIAEGAAAPAKDAPEPDPGAHWSFQPQRRPAVPNSPANAAGNPIDAFILNRLLREGLTPRPLASPETQLRRLYLDLIGVPPAPDELQSFLADSTPQAWETVVDRLLDDPRHGERWARHWMDIWRYSDWYGRRKENDVRNSASQIWRWRDWIVNSLNADHGYDRLIREMLAADEIAPDDDEAAVATGYLIRNFYSLNSNDWMRNVVEHTGKAFLGLTFNCAHCHDHKYDPITQDNYFQLRAVFEPIYIRQDRVPGEADPGKFQDYDYGGSRQVQRLGLVRIFDKLPDAPTWFYTGGDERNRVKDRGSILPGVPEFLTRSNLQVRPVALPPSASYPGLRPQIQETVLRDGRAAVVRAEHDFQAVQDAGAVPDPAALEELRLAEAKFDAALKESEQAGQVGALVGKQSLVLDATTGRRTLLNDVRRVKEVPDGSAWEFQVLLLADAHFNFQLAKDSVQGLTAGYFAWEKGRIVAWPPGDFTEAQVGQYDFAAGQRRFQVRLVLERNADRGLLTIRSLSDGALLVDSAVIAISGWNPVGNPKQGITFDARPGSVVVVDDVKLIPPRLQNASDTPSVVPLAAFDFEAPLYRSGRDIHGIDDWTISSFSAAPATSVVSSTAGNAALRELSQQTEVLRRVVELPKLRLQAAQLRITAARAELAGIESRIAADRARFRIPPAADAPSLIRTASQTERDAAVLKAEAEVLTQELAVTQAELKPQDDASRKKELDAAAAKLAAAHKSLEAAQAAVNNPALADTYTPLSPSYPAASTGRRRALAEWITAPNHPLTSRVAVNHIWTWHFHAPLVSSVNDFGRNGAEPTHPELLDWLAVELRESGWSMKHLHRLIVTSAAYRRLSSVGEARRNAELDPENKLLWRMNVGRLESETVRDSLLACAERLDLALGGQERENAETLTTFRRSLYYSVHPEGGGKGPLGELFDAPDPLDCYRRSRSIVPQQALALTNSDLVHNLSGSILATWNANHADPVTADEFISAMFRLILSRAPGEIELQVCCESLAVDGTSDENLKARESLIRALLNHNDFITIR